jgi:Mg2+ and Co2+ transporter CorA
MKQFSKLLRVRESMKSLQQISWSVSQVEKRYDIDEVDEQYAEEIVDVYMDYIPQIERLLDELKDEYAKEQKK